MDSEVDARFELLSLDDLHRGLGLLGQSPLVIGAYSGRYCRDCSDSLTKVPILVNGSPLPDAANGSFFLNLPRLYSVCRRKPDMAINGHRNKPFGPGGSTRRLHPSPAKSTGTGFGGAELGSTRV